MYDDTFDGAQLNVGNDKVQVQGAYGYMIDGAADEAAHENDVTWFVPRSHGRHGIC